MSTGWIAEEISQINQDGNDKAASEEPLFSQKFEILKSYYDQVKRLIDRHKFVFICIYKTWFFEQIAF